MIFFKNVPYEDLFIIFLAFRGHGRTHWALSGRCSPSEILILCPNEPCQCRNLSPRANICCRVQKGVSKERERERETERERERERKRERGQERERKRERERERERQRERETERE